MDSQHLSYLNQRIFTLWAVGALYPQAGTADSMSLLQLDRLRGQIAAEGYGDGGTLSEVIDQPIELPAAPVVCACSSCQENITRPLSNPYAYRLLTRCKYCGILDSCLGGLCDVCRGV